MKFAEIQCRRRNVDTNFYYFIKAVIVFMSGIIQNKLNILGKILFREL